MKNKKFTFSIFYLILVLSLAGQNLDGSISEQASAENEKIKNDFFMKYNLSPQNKISAKMLGAGTMRTAPEINSPKMDIVVAANESVSAYKYIPEHRCWLINYKDSWGFIEDYLIMAIKEESVMNYKDQWDVGPQIKTSIKPKYPEDAKTAKTEGNVELKIFINEEGQVTETIILNGIDGLNDAAIEAINKAKFEPAVKDGKKVGVWVPMRINFKL